MTRCLLLALALWASVAATAEAPATGWRPVPHGPLSPRDPGAMVWTGSEVLVIGGIGGPPTPPSASGATRTRPLRDGAAYDPATRSWRRIARAPVAIPWAWYGARIGRTVYLLSHGDGPTPRALLAYSIARDRWRRLRPPPIRRHADEYSLLDAGGRLVAYGGSDGEYGPGPARVYEHGRWSKLPRDPLSPATSRQLLWAGGRLIALACRRVPATSDDPCLVRAAAFDFATRAWERLPDSQIDAAGVWFAAGTRLVNPELGSYEGHPNGGILDLATRRWSPLPDPPHTRLFGVGVLTGTTGYYAASRGFVFDTTTDRWLRIPPIPRRPFADGRWAVAAGRDLFVWGANRWRGNRYVRLREAWIWAPPRSF
jgi:hypothetical protein